MVSTCDGTTHKITYLIKYAASPSFKKVPIAVEGGIGPVAIWSFSSEIILYEIQNYFRTILPSLLERHFVIMMQTFIDAQTGRNRKLIQFKPGFICPGGLGLGKWTKWSVSCCQDSRLSSDELSGRHMLPPHGRSQVIPLLTELCWQSQ